MTNAVRPASRRSQPALDPPLGADVDRRRRLVEDEDARVREQRAGEGDELALAEREPEPALAELRVVAVRELVHELVRADGVAPPPRSPRRVASGRPNAMFSAIVPAKRKPSCGTMPSWRRSDSWVTSRRSWPSIVIAPGPRVVEAREELRDRRLARARVADERDGRPRRDVEVEAVQDVGELAVAEVGRARSGRGPRRGGSSRASGRVHDLRLLVEDGDDPVERGRRREERVVELRELLDGIEEVREVEREGEERADR